MVLFKGLDADGVACAVVLDQVQRLRELAQLEEASIAAVAARLSLLGVLAIDAVFNNIGIDVEGLHGGQCRKLGIQLRRRDLEVAQARCVLDFGPKAPRSFTIIERRLVVRNAPVDHAPIN